MEVLVRPASPHEHDVIGALLVDAYGSVPGAVPDPEYDDELRRVGDRAREVPVLVAVSGAGEVLGALTYVPGPGPWAELARDGEAEIRMFAVTPPAQGRGVGSLLLDHVMQRARGEGFRRLVLSTSPWMTGAHRLYASRGFRRDPERDWSGISSGAPFELLAFVADL